MVRFIFAKVRFFLKKKKIKINYIEFFVNDIGYLRKFVYLCVFEILCLNDYCN